MVGHLFDTRAGGGGGGGVENYYGECILALASGG